MIGNLINAIQTYEKVAVAFYLNDCVGCAFLETRMDTRNFQQHGFHFVAVKFNELDPRDMAIMRKWKIDFTPQIRLHIAGKLISAVEGVDISWSKTHLNEFIADWVLRHSTRQQ